MFVISSNSVSIAGSALAGSSLHVVIMAAGLGTRMKSRRAKVLHQAGGMTMAELIVRQALRLAPAERIRVVTGYQAEEVERVLAPYNVRFARQTEQLGTGHAVLCAREFLEAEPGVLMIINGDCPLLRAETLVSLLESAMQPGVAGAVASTVLEDATGYGRMLRNAAGALEAIVEQKAATPAQREIREINTGIYAFDAAKFWPALKQVKPDNPAREYYLTDVVSILNAAGETLLPSLVEDPREVLGVNNRVELAVADALLRARTVQALMLEGVTIEKPETVTIDADVTVGPDSVIEAFAQLRGQTLVGPESRIGAGAVLRNVTLGAGAVVQPYCVLEDTVAGEGARIGPFARLRGGNALGDHVHIGNFVELKKTFMGDGAKANHLAYLGDSAVGAKSNVGAGTITCNYDGLNKSPTIIGDGCFIGSNATLVAPLRIEDGSYVAAGSVITHDVPSGSLAFGRARQTVKEDGAELIRRKAEERKSKG
ncbi:MAG: bifunctional UDP-N-acetylglucosamine diphosphorylase/glucosamine-1-phosphate N-acetyltransferase GlmU [Bryobacterales bacterium]|nr:bifunctional UDP-N-acetylglucosamine diphosphorylase/glucosamine-1-phosphate N-acetyltransferase GlmU [Bryobacterales bacterium]